MLASGALVAAGVANWALPVLQLPAPTGPAAVGTTVVQWSDETREEAATPEGDDRRTVVAQLWYPAVSGTGRRGRYLGRDGAEVRAVADGLAATFGVPALALDGARRGRTNARVDAQVAVGRERWPVVLFSPGLGGVRTQNSGWAEELASRGYVVVALDHPYDSAAVMFEDGRVARSRLRATGDDEVDNRSADGATAVRALDLRFAFRSLVAGAGLPPELVVRFDLDRVAVTGHSAGGAAAIQAATEEPGFAAVIDIDGLPRNVGSSAVPVPLLLFVAGRGTGSPTGDREYEVERRRVLDAALAGGYELTVPGASHLSFTDAPLFLPPLPALVGSGGRRHGIRVTARATDAFLRHVFDGGVVPDADLDGALGRDGTARARPGGGR